jgi:FkbM family methyltransferase
MSMSMREVSAVLVDVAFGRSARQSSTSEWSQPDDASRALRRTQFTGGFSFCTGAETDPHWVVDLDGSFQIQKIMIFNREDSASERAIPLRIDISVDGEKWEEIATIRYIFGGSLSNHPLDLHMVIPVMARFVKLTRLGPLGNFHLEAINIFTDIESLQTRSQLKQDLWVLAMSGGRNKGTFVEIGSTDGITINNTYMLENVFGWRGVCVEPNPEFYDNLKNNRVSKTFRRAVYLETGKILEFAPVGEFGTLKGFENVDIHSGWRAQFMQDNKSILVESISPTDLFVEGEMPNLIDYMSLDTEGSEWDILQNIDFSEYRFGMITVEHNFVHDKRAHIYDYLKSFGYLRFNAEFDDWYYHPVYLDVLNSGSRVNYTAVCAYFSEKYKYGGDKE